MALVPGVSTMVSSRNSSAGAVTTATSSSGASYVMPDLIGREAGYVVTALQSAGLKVSDVRYRSYPGVAPGIVLRQSPAAGHRVSSRTPLALDVSRGAS
jgi:beta-lactam-binding protein with PASTA domain